MALKTTEFNPAEYLETAGQAAEFIAALLEDNDPEVFRDCMRAVADASGIAELAEKTGMTRQGLYKALGENGDPKLSTVFLIAHAMNMKVALLPKAEPLTTSKPKSTGTRNSKTSASATITKGTKGTGTFQKRRTTRPGSSQNSSKAKKRA